VAVKTAIAPFSIDPTLSHGYWKKRLFVKIFHTAYTAVSVFMSGWKLKMR